MDLENFATACRRYTGDIHNSVRGRFVYVTYKTMESIRSRHDWMHMFITHWRTVTLHQIHNFDLFWTWRTSSFCTVAWQLARFQLTRCIARSLGDKRSAASHSSCNDMLAIISSGYQFGQFFYFFFAEVMSNYLTTDGLKNFLYFTRPHWGLRPVSFATSATWLVRHWTRAGLTHVRTVRSSRAANYKFCERLNCDFTCVCLNFFFGLIN